METVLLIFTLGVLCIIIGVVWQQAKERLHFRKGHSSFSRVCIKCDGRQDLQEDYDPATLHPYQYWQVVSGTSDPQCSCNHYASND